MGKGIILVTGATGLVGSNVCEMAVKRGYGVRALVRSAADTEYLTAVGAELVSGDVTVPDSLDKAMRGADYVVHCAAQIGGSWSKAAPKDFEDINQWGTINTLAAAERAGVKRTVSLLTPVLFDRSETFTERSRIVPIGPQHSPYTRTKLAALYEALARAARGQDIVFAIPGGIYGPAPIFHRAIVPTSFNGTLLMALAGELKRFLGTRSNWSLATDVAMVSLLALEKGELGARYIACGRDDDDMTLPEFCNLALEMAGRPHRVSTFNPATAGPEEMAEFGTMLKYLQSSYPKPMMDSSHTAKTLGFEPTPIAEGMRQTLDWFRANGKL